MGRWKKISYVPPPLPGSESERPKLIGNYLSNPNTWFIFIHVYTILCEKTSCIYIGFGRWIGITRRHYFVQPTDPPIDYI
jgi:hypothetical protein